MQLAIVIPLGELGTLPGNALPGGPPFFPGNALPGPQPGGPLPTPPIHLPPQAGQLPIYPADPTHPIAIPPGSVYPPIGPQVPAGKALALVLISGVGYRWTVIDTSLVVNPSPGVNPL